MFPWNFFNMSKSGFNPFNYINDKHFQKMFDQMSNQAFPENFSFLWEQSNTGKKSAPQSDINEVVFETHDYIYIRIPIQNERQINQIKIYYSLNKCMVDGLSDKNSPYTIILPATVRKKGAKAIYKDGILEIKIPKNNEWQYSQIDVDKL